MSQATKAITLAGKDYPVTKLSVRQLRTVVPAILALLTDLGPMIAQIQKVKDEKGSTLALISAFQLTEKQFDMLVDCVWGTISKLNKITREELLDLELTVDDLFNALPMVMEMAGLVPAGDPVPGEALPPQDEVSKT